MNMELRGKCQEYAEAFVNAYPDYRIAKGYYIDTYHPHNKQGHWWAVHKVTGEIYDPTAEQFDDNGYGEYIEVMEGTIICCECGKTVPEKDGIILNGRYAACSNKCAMAFVGL